MKIDALAFGPHPDDAEIGAGGVLLKMKDLGHTTGITTSSRPVVAHGETAELVAGSFLNLEPGIFVPGVGSACIENTVYVTETGAEPINGFGLDIQVV